MVKAKVSRWGNSLAVRLPAEVVREFGLAEGQMLELKARKPVLEMTAPTQRRYIDGIPVYTMAELVADMERLDPGAVPPLLDWGAPRGSEIIDDEYSRGEIGPDDVIVPDAEGR